MLKLNQGHWTKRDKKCTSCPAQDKGALCIRLLLLPRLQSSTGGPEYVHRMIIIIMITVWTQLWNVAPRFSRQRTQTFVTHHNCGFLDEKFNSRGSGSHITTSPFFKTVLTIIRASNICHLRAFHFFFSPRWSHSETGFLLDIFHYEITPSTASARNHKMISGPPLSHNLNFLNLH